MHAVIFQNNPALNRKNVRWLHFAIPLIKHCMYRVDPWFYLDSFGPVWTGRNAFINWADLSITWASYRPRHFAELVAEFIFLHQRWRNLLFFFLQKLSNSQRKSGRFEDETLNFTPHTQIVYSRCFIHFLHCRFVSTIPSQCAVVPKLVPLRATVSVNPGHFGEGTLNFSPHGQML